MISEFSRTELLLGEEGMKKLKSAKVEVLYRYVKSEFGGKPKNLDFKTFPQYF